MLYHARATTDKRGRVEIDFPDCPGCQTFADIAEEALAVAQEAHDGWLEAHLVDGEAPPPPSAKPAKRHSLAVPVSPALAIALQVRWRRQELGLSQSGLGKKLGVTRQQVALLEQPTGNLKVSTLERIAEALDLHLSVDLTPMML